MSESNEQNTKTEWAAVWDRVAEKVAPEGIDLVEMVRMLTIVEVVAENTVAMMLMTLVDATGPVTGRTVDSFEEDEKAGAYMAAVRMMAGTDGWTALRPWMGWVRREGEGKDLDGEEARAAAKRVQDVMQSFAVILLTAMHSEASSLLGTLNKLCEQTVDRARNSKKEVN